MSHVHQVLDELIKTLTNRLAAARADVVSLERELEDAKKARGALGEPEPGLSHASGSGTGSRPRARENVALVVMVPPRDLTIKGLVRKALKETFPNGATAQELLEHFASAWGRRIMRTSLSPQLTRLEQREEIEREGNVWRLRGPEKDEAPADPLS